MQNSSNAKKNDSGLIASLRPKTFKEYIGQTAIKDNLNILMEAAKKRNEPLEHILLYGPTGLGKTSLAHIIAREMNANIKVTSGPAIDKVGDLASILTNINEGDAIFIDEIHRLPRPVEEMLYPAMEDFKLDIVIGKGPSARTLQLDLPRFTLIGATTRIGLITAPLRGRFGIVFKFNFYNKEEIEHIIDRSRKILSIPINKSSISLIAERSRQTPRIANRLLKRVRDYAMVKNNGVLSDNSTKKALQMLNIDKLGLEETDRKLIEIIIQRFEGGPVGLQSLAAATNEEKDTITDIYEPYLLQLGFLVRTPRGRMATKLAYKHLKMRYNENKQGLLI